MTRVTIRPPRASDQESFIEAVRRSSKLHRPWVSPPSSARAFHAYLARCERDSHVSFLVCLGSTGELAGVVNISEIVRGLLQSGYLGYCAFVPHHRGGLMTEGMRLVISHAFRSLKLHRLEANIQPGNEASIALVRRLGFRYEGLSRRYLKIGGRWRDHERWALLSDHGGRKLVGRRDPVGAKKT